MTIIQTDWQQFLTPTSELPPDVTFKVLGKGTDLDGSMSGEVSAHRFLLAGTNPVFRKMFFGPMKESSDVVMIKDTTIEAFSMMIRYIYTPPGPNNFSLSPVPVSCPQTLCEILNIATTYQVIGLREAAEEALRILPITKDNMLFTAATARNYSVFDDVSKMLTTRCIKFLTEDLKTVEDVFSFIQRSHETFPEADPSLLPELLLERRCGNCGRIGRHCLDGREVTGMEEPAAVRKGVRLRVAHSRQGPWMASLGTVYSVTSLYTWESLGGSHSRTMVEHFPALGDPGSYWVTLDPGNIKFPLRNSGHPHPFSFACSTLSR